MEKKLTFIDAYAGIGGFHSAIDKIGGTCKAAIEYDDELRSIYEDSYSMENLVKDFKVFSQERNKYDVDWFFAGFPCQPFSKAGARQGFSDGVNGSHFNHIITFLKYNNAKNVLLENVPNLLTHDNNKSINKIITDLKSLNYELNFITEISPHDFGIPLFRPRLFMLFSKETKRKISFDLESNNKPTSIHEHISDRAEYSIDEDMNAFFDRTFRLLRGYCREGEGLSIPKPMWLDESLYDGNSYIDNALPKYSETVQKWKANILYRNRKFFQHEGVPIEYSNFQNLPLSKRKIEYNSADQNFSMKDKIIQLRPSGVRISDKWYLPTIVRSSTQIPWVFHTGIGKFVQCSEKDILNLNGINLTYKPEQKRIIYKALGNCVNARVVENILNAFYGNE